jgi:heme exporter protein D
MSHSMFIWSAYGAAAVLLIGMLIASLRGLRRREAELSAAESAGTRRRRGGGAQ